MMSLKIIDTHLYHLFLSHAGVLGCNFLALVELMPVIMCASLPVHVASLQDHATRWFAFSVRNGLCHSLFLA